MIILFSLSAQDLFLKISTALYHKYTILQNLSSVDQLSSKAYESIDSKSICAGMCLSFTSQELSVN